MRERPGAAALHPHALIRGVHLARAVEAGVHAAVLAVHAVLEPEAHARVQLCAQPIARTDERFDGVVISGHGASLLRCRRQGDGAGVPVRRANGGVGVHEAGLLKHLHDVLHVLALERAHGLAHLVRV